jgi:hypothetical protein
LRPALQRNKLGPDKGGPVTTIAVRHQKFTIFHMITGVAIIPTAVLLLLFFIEKLIYR